MPEMTDATSPAQLRHNGIVAFLTEFRAEQTATLHAIHDTLAEIRDRLPEREGEPKCGDVHLSDIDRPCDLPPGHRGCHDSGDGSQWWHDPADHPNLVAANVEAIKHEVETPMRGHGECCEPAPADDGLAEWERELLRPTTCCGKCPPIAGGGYDCTCEGNPHCEKADTPEEWHDEPAPDVDPDEALAVIINELVDDHGGTSEWADNEYITRSTALAIARAARKHIGHEAQMGNARLLADMRVRAEKAEAEAERLRGLSLGDLRRKVEAEADLAGMTLQRDKYATQAEKWQARHAALRADVERVRRNRTTLTDVLMCIADVLDYDDERGEQA